MEADDQIFTSVELPIAQRTLIDLSGSPRVMSSKELRQSVHAVATALRAAGTLPRTSVALLAERSAAYIAAQLAIWQLGAAILPLDPAAPRERLLWQIDHARPSAILTDAVEPPPVTCAVVSLAGTLLRAGTQDAFQLPEGVSHVLFTSGSTGTPKAVLGSRRGLVARCRWMWRSYPFADGEVCVQKTPSVFVDSLWETFGPLARGVLLVVAPSSAVRDPQRLLAVLEEHQVSRIVLVPAALRLLLDAAESAGSPLRALRLVSVSGDALPTALAARAVRLLPHARLLNLYGSTEVSADVTSFDVGAALATGSPLPAICPLGTPIAGAVVQLLQPAAVSDDDEAAEAVAADDGAAGEIAISGELLALGYLRAPALTAARFVRLRGESGVWFRTGDLAEWREGALVFLGRVAGDWQLKLRGARVEPREVEASFEGFTHRGRPLRAAIAVPLLTDTSGTGVRSADELCLCFCLGGDDSGDESGGPRLEPVTSAEAAPAMRAWAATRLAAHMAPSFYLALRSLPTLPSGKPDRLRLQQAAPALVAELQAHVGREAEGGGGGGDSGAVAALREEIGAALGLGAAVAESEAFVARGGTSVLAAKVAFALRQRGWDLPPEALLDADASAARLSAQMRRLAPPSAGEAADAEEEAAAERRSLRSWQFTAGASRKRPAEGDEEAAPWRRRTTTTTTRLGSCGHRAIGSRARSLAAVATLCDGPSAERARRTSGLATATATARRRRRRLRRRRRWRCACSGRPTSRCVWTRRRCSSASHEAVPTASAASASSSALTLDSSRA